MGYWNKNHFLLGTLNTLALILCICMSQSAQPRKDEKLRLLVSLFRHADRVPGGLSWESFPTDPNKNVNFAEGKGQLTKAGKKRAYDYGVALRKSYNDFLGESYYHQEVIAYSTDTVRTKMSLQVVMAGMYPPPPSQSWNTNLKWQPVYIRAARVHADGLLLPRIASSRYMQAYNEILASDEVQRKLKEFQPLMHNLTSNTGKNHTLPVDMATLYQTFASQSNMKLTLPSWATTLYPEGQLKDGIKFEFQLQNYNDKLKRLNGGIILNKIINDMNAVINGTVEGSKRKVFLYSAHDITVAALMSVLGVYENELPAFCSAIMLELREDVGHYLIRLIYNSGIPATIKYLTIPGCEPLCPYEKFLNLTAKFMPSSEELQDVSMLSESSI